MWTLTQTWRHTDTDTDTDIDRNRNRDRDRDSRSAQRTGNAHAHAHDHQRAHHIAHRDVLPRVVLSSCENVMIDYTSRDYLATLRHHEVLRLENFRLAFMIAGVSSLLTTVLVSVDDFLLPEHRIRNMGLEAGSFGIFTSVLGFLLSFRASQAFNRFWDGASAAYEVVGGLHTAASSLLAFAHYGTAPAVEVDTFKQTVVRLVSLLSAMMLTHLEGRDTMQKETGYEILDLTSLQMNKIRVLAKEAQKTEMVIQWIKLLIIKSMSAGTLSIPAPILTRVFQEIDVSVGKYHSAEKLSQVPFPFPYAATMDVFLVFHALCTCFVMINTFDVNSYWCIPTTGLVVFFLWSLHLVAGELENPFDCGTHDLDLQGLHKDLNEKLRMICGVQPDDVPCLLITAEQAGVGGGVKYVRRA